MVSAVRLLAAVPLVVCLLVTACTAEDPVQRSDKESPLVILKPKRRALTPEERASLGFPPELISRVESAAGSEALPFYETILIPSENLKGDAMISHGRLAGFTVQTRRADKLIAELSAPLRDAGYLIFRSEQNLGALPDLVSVIPGRSSYDILKSQKTEAQHYNLGTDDIIRWLRQQQRIASFTITGAGPDWLEAKFTKTPKNLGDFAARVALFAPDVLRQDMRTVERLAGKMKEMNGFYLWWD